MIAPGTKIAHVKSANFISEMADQFNIAGIQGADNTGRIVLIIGRDQIDITEDTLVETAPGSMQAQTLPDALVMSRIVFANITMTLTAAKALVTVLGTAVEQAEQGQLASQTPPQA